MTTKKIVVVVVSIVVVLGLIVAIFAGAIVGIALYQIGNSEAADTARNFLRNNERLKQDIGEVKDSAVLLPEISTLKTGTETRPLISRSSANARKLTPAWILPIEMASPGA